jgi:sugar lactone lactonase YvrE
MLTPITRALARQWLPLAFAGLAFGSTHAMAQTIDTVAGNGESGYSGDGGPAIAASLRPTRDVVVDAQGNFYFTELYGYRIRKVSVDGTISTVIGNGTEGSDGDGGPASEARIGLVYQIAVDAAGNLYFADWLANRVRRVGTDGIVQTVVGNGEAMHAGDGGPATEASINHPVGIAVDRSGNLFIGESANGTYDQYIRKVSPQGVISTFAGNGEPGFGGDGGPATAASLSLPEGLTTDADGNLFIADLNNARIRRVTPAGIITTVVGGYGWDPTIDELPADQTTLSQPMDVAVAPNGDIFIADLMRIRRLSSDGLVHAVAGKLYEGYAGDGGPAIDALFYYTPGIALDAAGNLLVADLLNYRIRKITMPPAPTFTTCAAEGFKGGKLALCRQVCEASHAPNAHAALIVDYLRLYREDPPCAR